jgi:hypothetical protein
MGRIGNHVRAHAIGYAALFVALGGTAVASHEAIRSSDIVDDQVRSIDIRDAQVQSVDVLNNALSGEDIDEATLEGLARGATAYRTIDASPGFSNAATIPGVATIAYDCPANHLANDGTITFQNAAGAGLDLFIDDGAEDPIFDRVPPGGSRSLPAALDGDQFVYSLYGALSGNAAVWGRIEVNTVHRPPTGGGYGDSCLASVQALLSPQ